MSDDTTKTEQAAGREASTVERLVMRCATCRHWQGDKDKVIKVFNENPVSMDLFKGWPEEGACGISYEWLNIEDEGHTRSQYTVDANFGCVYWAA